jgi:hypothetical protein
VIADPAGYAFVWTDPTGDRVGALVDATDGDYAIEGSDGLAIRVVEGVPYTRADGKWTLTDLSVLGNRPVPALDGFPTIERVIHAGIAPYVRDTATTDTEQGTTFAYLVDDSSLFAADPAVREAWLLPWGLRDGHRPPPVADPTELTDARSDARPGQVVVAFTVSPSGELVTVTVASPAVGGVGVLDQIGTSAEPASIELSD